VQKQDSSGTAKAVWDFENILLETDQNDATQVIYTQAGAVYGNLVSQFRTTATNYYHFDGPGSVDRVTDNMMSTTDSYVYDAFGTVRVTSG
jgi:hypothetical protein